MSGPRRPLPPEGPSRPDRPFRPGPRRPATPFTVGDTSVLDPAAIQRQAAKTQDQLRRTQVELWRLRFGPGPDNTDPDVVPTTRMDGQWPFLLIRTYAGDSGQRPVLSGDAPERYFGNMSSPDIIVTPAGPDDEARTVDRSSIDELTARALPTTLQQGTAYDIWVHVWNLGQTQVSGVRIRVRARPSELLGPENPTRPEEYLGGATVDLGDRLSERAHLVIKAARYVAPVRVDESETLLVATADTLTDPASGDLSPGSDRHSAHCWVRLRQP